MKIIHCLIQYLPEYVAGTEVYTHTLAQLQKAKGHEVAVITPHIEFYKPGSIQDHYQFDGVDVYQFMETADPSNRDIYTGRKKPEGLNNFKSLLQRLRPDIIHFQELNRSIGLTVEHVKVARQFGAKVFLTMHLSFYTCYTNTLITHKHLCKGRINEYVCSSCAYNSIFKIPLIAARPLAAVSLVVNRAGIRQLLGKNKISTLASMPAFIKRIKTELQELSEHANKIIALTDWYQHILLLNNVPAAKIAVIRQAIASESVPAIKFRHRTIELPIRIAFVGRLQQQKGVHVMLEAARSFTESEVIIDVYGKEEASGYYKHCVAKIDALPNVALKGLLSREAVVETLSTYDFLCLPSVFSEMSPLVIQEAFAAGIPVIASKVYGNMEQVQHGVKGLLFEFNSAADLTEQIRTVVNNPELVINLKQNVKAPGSFNEVNEHYLKLYESC